MLTCPGGDRTILFLTDGQPSDSTSSIMSTIRNEYASQPDVTLLTFGFGDGLSSTDFQRLQVSGLCVQPYNVL